MSVPDLAFVLLASRIVALVNGNMDVLGQAFSGHVDGHYRRRGLRLIGDGAGVPALRPGRRCPGSRGPASTDGRSISAPS
jgi:hypothetical protein